MEEMNTIAQEELATEEVNAPETVDEAAASEAVSDEYYELSGLTEGQRMRKEIFDKITTGILIFLMASPFLILIYIFLWFILR